MSINSNLQVNGVSLCGQDDLVRAWTAGPAAKKQNRKGDLKWKPIWTFGHPGGVLQKEWSNQKSEVRWLGYVELAVTHTRITS